MIRQWLRAEFEAYEEECQLAARLHAVNAFELCPVYAQSGREGLRRTVVESLANVPAFAEFAGLIRQYGATMINN